MGILLKVAYDQTDKNKVHSLLEELEVLYEDADVLRKKHRRLWLSMNKPFGWEVLDIRYGGVLSRLETAKHRLKQWLEGDIFNIEELKEERLYYEGPWKCQKALLVEKCITEL